MWQQFKGGNQNNQHYHPHVDNNVMRIHILVHVTIDLLPCGEIA